jgi:glycosyltransferase involved in cell wall biosynthesis
MIIGDSFVNRENRKAELENLAESLGIRKSIRFLGFRTDIPYLMAACDLIVLASRYEGCSRTLCEAQAMGRPVLATNVGGNPEIIEEKKTGLLFPVGHLKKLSELIIYLATNPDILNRMGEQARIRAVRDLSIQRYHRQVMHIYGKVLEGET